MLLASFWCLGGIRASLKIGFANYTSWSRERATVGSKGPHFATGSIAHALQTIDAFAKRSDCSVTNRHILLWSSGAADRSSDASATKK